MCAAVKKEGENYCAYHFKKRESFVYQNQHGSLQKTRETLFKILVDDTLILTREQSIALLKFSIDACLDLQEELST